METPPTRISRRLMRYGHQGRNFVKVGDMIRVVNRNSRHFDQAAVVTRVTRFKVFFQAYNERLCWVYFWDTRVVANATYTNDNENVHGEAFKLEFPAVTVMFLQNNIMATANTLAPYRNDIPRMQRLFRVFQIRLRNTMNEIIEAGDDHDFGVIVE